jgi:aminoglycoside phosphotransferase (APT) family kinase protein
MVANVTMDEFLWQSGLAERSEHGDWAPLTGGVSSDIWRVNLNGRTLCVKRALGKLKVSADWFASPQRNAYEWAWLQFAARHFPANVPAPLAHDPADGVLAMSFLPSEDYPNWKEKLLKGEVDVEFAQDVGHLMGRLHSLSAKDPSLIGVLGDTKSFEAIRLDPYLSATGAHHPPLAAHLLALINRTKSIRIAAVHGDISPKNILAGPAGPVFLDAEAAWYGDPAFDLAFCLNHLLLKCVARPAGRLSYLQSFMALFTAYRQQIDWELPGELEHRAATLLPALLLARIDGKSPVEYLSDELDRQFVRSVAMGWIQVAPLHLTDLARQWDECCQNRPKKHRG